METYMENWSKRDLQVAILQALASAVAIHFGIVYLFPYLMSLLNQVHGYRSSSTALSEVQNMKSSRGATIGSLEEEAERLRNEMVDRNKTVASKPTQQVIPIEDRFRIQLESADASVPNTHQSGLVEHRGDAMNRSQTVVRSEQTSNSGKNFRLRDHIYSSENETRAATTPVREQESRGVSKAKSRVKKRRPSNSSSATVSTSTAQPSTVCQYSIPNYNIKNDHEDERQATLSEQDLAYDISLRSDRTQKLLKEERAAEFHRLVKEYTAVTDEPEASDPEAITVVFKISDDVYAKRTHLADDDDAAAAASGLKHKKISRRFFPLDTVQSLFSFIFCHIYQFPGSGLEERYLGGSVPALFAPRLHGDEDFAVQIQENADFISFDLICSYPKVVLHSSALFFKDDNNNIVIRDHADDVAPPQTILDLGIKNNTLLSLRPTH